MPGIITSSKHGVERLALEQVESPASVSADAGLTSFCSR